MMIHRKIGGEAVLGARFGPLLDLAQRVRSQYQHQRGPKVYASHAPEVECIGKGKARAPYEFGCKARIATPVTFPKGGQFVLHAKALHGNPFDGHTLGPVVADMEKLTGVEAHRIHVDKRVPRPQPPASVQGLDLGARPPRHRFHPARDEASCGSVALPCDEQEKGCINRRTASLAVHPNCIVVAGPISSVTPSVFRTDRQGVRLNPPTPTLGCLYVVPEIDLIYASP
ncbi:hypothetical protein ABIA03_000109 [Bradyrhizobium yuanmingense]|uniref:Uncharacterized protein n=1 Tax=Bradyrhizobium yuanmingense TaxID=108015 RepID=A0ABV4G8F3_9BRAD